MDKMKYLILVAVVLTFSADAISLDHLPSSLEASSIQGQLNAWRSGAKWFPSSYFDQLPDDEFVKSSSSEDESQSSEFIGDGTSSEDTIDITGFNGFDNYYDDSQPINYPEVKRHMNERDLGHRSNYIFQEICPSEKTVVNLEEKNPHLDIRPFSYEEVTCRHAHGVSYSEGTNKVCHGFAKLYTNDNSIGMKCVQLKSEIRIAEKVKGESDVCWKIERRIINSGCECRWPKHDLKDISVYH